MTWTEAYSRAAKAVLAIALVYLVGVIVAAVGGVLIATENVAGFIVGGIFVLVAVLGIILAILAVWIKMITEAIVDNVKTDLSEQIKELAKSNRDINNDLSKQIEHLADLLRQPSPEQGPTPSEIVDPK